jgi:hypothetical protein
MVLVLTSLAGLGYMLDNASSMSIGDKIAWPAILFFAALGGPIYGVVSLYLGGALLRWTGRWIGGRGTPQHIEAALAWSSVPLVWGLGLWLIELPLFGQDLFTTETPRIDERQFLQSAFIAIISIEKVIAVWAFIVFLKCLGQVQGFSAWRALGNAALAWGIIFVPLGVIVVYSSGYWALIF